MSTVADFREKVSIGARMRRQLCNLTNWCFLAGTQPSMMMGALRGSFGHKRCRCGGEVDTTRERYLSARQLDRPYLSAVCLFSASC